MERVGPLRKFWLVLEARRSQAILLDVFGRLRSRMLLELLVFSTPLLVQVDFVVNEAFCRQVDLQAIVTGSCDAFLQLVDFRQDGPHKGLQLLLSLLSDTLLRCIQQAVLKFKICKVLCFGILAEHGLQKALREGHVVEGLVLSGILQDFSEHGHRCRIQTKRSQHFGIHHILHSLLHPLCCDALIDSRLHGLSHLLEGLLSVPHGQACALKHGLNLAPKNVLPFHWLLGLHRWLRRLAARFGGDGLPGQNRVHRTQTFLRLLRLLTARFAVVTVAAVTVTVRHREGMLCHDQAGLLICSP
mmetsp:Transcript_16886/g.39786  ORF Transcript_16886/g.39786 Transcript_16886/m.39786 type:complete len:301 (-) Transcript_16886:269-1171(-)